MLNKSTLFKAESKSDIDCSRIENKQERPQQKPNTSKSDNTNSKNFESFIERDELQQLEIDIGGI